MWTTGVPGFWHTARNGKKNCFFPSYQFHWQIDMVPDTFVGRTSPSLNAWNMVKNLSFGWSNFSSFKTCALFWDKPIWFVFPCVWRNLRIWPWIKTLVPCLWISTRLLFMDVNPLIHGKSFVFKWCLSVPIFLEILVAIHISSHLCWQIFEQKSIQKFHSTWKLLFRHGASETISLMKKLLSPIAKLEMSHWFS